jgi:hypothetical protein
MGKMPLLLQRGQAHGLSPPCRYSEPSSTVVQAFKGTTPLHLASSACTTLVNIPLATAGLSAKLTVSTQGHESWKGIIPCESLAFQIVGLK